MAWKSKDIKHLMKQDRARGPRKPVADLEDIELRRRLERDILDLLRSIENRKDFIDELKKLTARYGQQVGSEQYDRALQAFDEYWRGRGKPSP